MDVEAEVADAGDEVVGVAVVDAGEGGDLCGSDFGGAGGGEGGEFGDDDEFTGVVAWQAAVSSGTMPPTNLVWVGTTPSSTLALRGMVMAMVWVVRFVEGMNGIGIDPEGSQASGVLSSMGSVSTSKTLPSTWRALRMPGEGEPGAVGPVTLTREEMTTLARPLR